MGVFTESEINPKVVASVPFFGGLLALVMVAVLMMRVKKAPNGDGAQIFIAKQISEGAESFLKTEYAYLLPFVACVAAFIVGILESQDRGPLYWMNDTQSYVQSSKKGGWQTMICFLCGAALSATAGWAGLKVATQTNVKTMEAARLGLNPALQIAFAGGAVMGFSVVAFGLLGMTVLFYIFATAQNNNSLLDMRDAIRYLSGFGFGASAIALFARVAGGIYTKAADVGADLVGKVEANIPEDDPRNPATVADNVGDNVGDVAGMGADLFESFCGSIIACAALSSNTRELALPFWIAGFGILAACIGFWTVSTKDDASQSDLLHALHRGVYSASILVIVFSVACVEILFDGNKQGYRYFGCIILGLVAGILIGEATEFCTSYAYGPTKSITHAGSAGGAATVIIQGLGIGMISVFPPTVIICATVIACFNVAGAGPSGLYGIAIAAVGMLSTLGVTLATDAYGPVADNAGGIAEMSPDVPEEVRERTDKLDALGNTTAATGKGFAIGSAVLTALSLMNAYVQDVPYSMGDNPRALAAAMTLTDPYVLSGIVFGAMLPFLFAALTMLSVRKAAGAIIVEVQRQFRDIPGLLEGKEGVVCDHMACVTMCTKASVDEMILPGVIAVFTPIAVGLLIGAKCLGGLLAGAISSGFMLAVMMSNAGGAWDNSKKYIENEKVYGGKKSDTHKACVVGDTVGDPFKDTSGPALNILIKLMTIFSLTMAPVFRSDWTTWWYGVFVLCVEIAAVMVAYYYVWVRNGEKCIPPEHKK